MAVPKQRKTKSRRNQRRMHLFIKAKNFMDCPKCGKPALPHKVCFNCGYYKGREVINVLKKLDKKEKKQREKEIKSKEKEKDAPGKKSLNWEGLSRK